MVEIKKPELPYETKALEPAISAKTLEFHFGKHHLGYWKKLNVALEKVKDEVKAENLQDLIIESKEQDWTKIYNCAAQTWNHTFYWSCMAPTSDIEDSPEFPACLKGTQIGQGIETSFGSADEFKKQFLAAAAGLFGSGWAWLVVDDSGKLEIVKTTNADTPILDQKKPVLVCDVWEHAYYIDYQNARASYVAAFFKLINWKQIEQNYIASRE